VLPGGARATDDAWRCALETALDEREEQSAKTGSTLKDRGEAPRLLLRSRHHSTSAGEERGDLRDFSLEAWLETKIEAEGTAEQRREFAAFVANLDSLEVPNSVELGEFAANPLVEVEVCRDLDLGDLDLGEDDDAETAGRRENETPGVAEQPPMPPAPPREEP